MKVLAFWDYIYHKILGFPISEDKHDEKGLK